MSTSNGQILYLRITAKLKLHNQISNLLNLSPTATYSVCSKPSIAINWHQSLITVSQYQRQHNNNHFNGPLSGTTQVSWYQKRHLLTHHPDHHPIFIRFFHLLRSIASSLFKLRAWQCFCTTSLHVLFVVYLLVWSPPLHIPCISSPNQCLLFATHAHTITTNHNSNQTATEICLSLIYTSQQPINEWKLHLVK